MAILSLKDQDGVIPNNLRADVMRKSMENKNLLTHKGSLYIGTGTTESYEVDGNQVNICQTSELTPGSPYTVLKVKVIDSDTSLQYAKVDKFMVVSDEYNIKCSDAVNVDHGGNATRATYASDDHSKGTIDSRLNALEYKETGTCLINNLYGGTVQQNQLFLQDDFVRMELRITGCSLNSSAQMIITIPTQFRPKGFIPISLCLQGTIESTGTTDDGYDNYTYDIGPTYISFKGIIGPDGTIYARNMYYWHLMDSIYYSSRRGGDGHSYYTDCKGVYITAGWHIKEPTADCIVDKKDSSSIRIVARSGGVSPSSVSKVRFCYTTSPNSNTWTYIESRTFYSSLGPSMTTNSYPSYAYATYALYEFTNNPKKVKVQIYYTDGSYLESDIVSFE